MVSLESERANMNNKQILFACENTLNHQQTKLAMTQPDRGTMFEMDDRCNIN